MKYNVDEYFHPVPGSKQEEDIVLFARRHWVSYLSQILLSVFMILLPFIIWILLYLSDSHIYQGNVRNIIVIAISIYYLTTITFTYATWITYYYDVYIVTKSTLIDITQEGFFGRKIAQLSLLRVQDVSSNIKGILPTLFAYGDVLIETAGEAENFCLEAVPNPQEFSARVLKATNELIARERRRRETMEGEGTLRPGAIGSEDFPGEVEPEGQVISELEKEESEMNPKNKTEYQKLLEKDIRKQKEGNYQNETEFPNPQPKPDPEPSSSQPIEEKESVENKVIENDQGEISKDDLNKGGEVKF